MIRKITVSICTLLFLVGVNGQQIVWASEVIEVSSEYSSSEFGAPRVLGEPDAIGLGTKKSNAWLPEKISKEEFITVGFDQPIEANQLIIGEAENPGAIKAVYVYDEDLHEYTHLEIEPEWVQEDFRFFHRKFEETQFEVHAIKVVLDVTAVPGRNTIDAIGVVNSEKSIIDLLTKKILFDTRSFRTEHMGDEINTVEYEEHNPILSPDGDRLYFSRQFYPENVGGAKDPEDIWYSDRIGDDGWSPAKNLGPPWNNKGPNFICSITEINGIDYFLLGNVYAGKNRVKEGVSIARIDNNGNFSKPEKLVIENFYNYSDLVDYYLYDENTLLISVWREEGYGDRDIYISKKNRDVWTKPENLGPTINTFEEEGSPQMDPSGKTLYFSSRGYNGMGGMDIYRSDRLDDTWKNWSTPTNLGVIINGSKDENYCSFSKDNRDQFYSKGDSLNTADIYHVYLKPKNVFVTGRVLDAQSGESLGNAFIQFSDSKGNEYFSTAAANGVYELEVPSNRDWVVSASLYGHELVSPLNVKISTEKKTLDNLLLRNVVKKGEYKPPKFYTYINAETREIFNYKVLFFNLNQVEIRHSNYSKLQELARYLGINPELRIEIHGRSDSTTEIDLSKNRATRISNYLVNYGVSSSRIKIPSFEESRLVSDCGNTVDCSEGRNSQNSRMEIRIIR